MDIQKPIASVALVIYNDAGEIFTIQELQKKPQFWKIPGMMDYSFPWETQEPGESDEATLRRVRREEVDELSLMQFSEPELFCSRLPIINDRVTVTAYSARYEGGPTNVRGSAAGTEIEPLGFHPPQFLLSRCRGGIRKIMEVFQASLVEKPLLVPQT